MGRRDRFASSFSSSNAKPASIEREREAKEGGSKTEREVALCNLANCANLGARGHVSTRRDAGGRGWPSRRRVVAPLYRPIFRPSRKSPLFQPNIEWIIYISSLVFLPVFLLCPLLRVVVASHRGTPSFVPVEISLEEGGDSSEWSSSFLRYRVLPHGDIRKSYLGLFLLNQAFLIEIYKLASITAANRTRDYDARLNLFYAINNTELKNQRLSRKLWNASEGRFESLSGRVKVRINFSKGRTKSNAKYIIREARTRSFPTSVSIHLICLVRVRKGSTCRSKVFT